MEKTRIVILVLFSFYSSMIGAENKCDRDTIKIIEEQEKQISIGNIAVAKSLVSNLDKCGLEPAREFEILTLLAKRGDFVSQQIISNTSVDWLKLLAYRGDKNAMREYGGHILREYSKEGFYKEGMCWILSSLVLGDEKSINILKSLFSEAGNQEGLILVDGMEFYSRKKISLFQPDIYVEYNYQNLKDLKTKASLNLSSWREKVKSNNMHYLLEVLDETINLIESNIKSTERKTLYTGSCDIDNRFTPKLKSKYFDSLLKDHK